MMRKLATGLAKATPSKTTAEWHDYFEHNRHNRLEIPWSEGLAVEPHLRDPLIRSLQRFQVGESGEGEHLKRGAAATRDAAYAAAIDLFIKEEQEHARLLACILERLGAPLLDGHWSDACFILLRRVAGLNLELAVLMIAELIAKRYYRAIYDSSEEPVLRAVCAQILRDEVGHVSFHCDHFRGALARRGRLTKRVLLGAWRAAFRVISLIVAHDHRGLLRATGVTPLGFWRECGVIFERDMAVIFSETAGLVSQPAAGIGWTASAWQRLVGSISGLVR